MSCIITTNTIDGNSMVENSIDTQSSIVVMTQWLADKRGVSINLITVGDILIHLATMAPFNDTYGIPTFEPERTNGDAYDDLRDSIASINLHMEVD